MKKNEYSEKELSSISERRKIDNEVVFRKANEKVQKDFEKLNKIAKEEGDESLISVKDMHLHFYCECSDENCHERIVLSLSKYKKLHKDRSKFILLPNHEVPSLENVIAKNIEYNVVDKFITPSETATTLSSTSVNNA